jgi:LysM repeat protein
MKRMSLLVSICLVLAATVTGCRLVAPTPDPAVIERLVAEAVRATIEAMPTATPYPTYTPALVPLAATHTPTTGVYTPRPTHTAVAGSPELQDSSTFNTHVVVAGDTLSALAKKYGTTVEAIVEANGLKDAGLIIIGQVLSIPVGEVGPTSTPATPASPTPTETLVPPTTTPTETPAS